MPPFLRTASSSRRLSGHDYTLPHFYFVTICIEARRQWLGTVTGSGVILTALGSLVEEEWRESGNLRTGISIDEWVVMPDHMHMILQLGGDHAGAAPIKFGFRRPANSLGSLIAQFKATTTRRARIELGYTGMRIWQRNYYDRIIRGPRELDRIRRYVRDNPIRWAVRHVDPVG